MVIIKRSCNYGNLGYFHPHQQLKTTTQTGVDTLPLRGEFAFDNHRNNHTSFFFAFSQRGYLFSCLRVFVRHHTGAPDLKGVFFSLCFWQIQSGASNRPWLKIPTTNRNKCTCMCALTHNILRLHSATERIRSSATL